MDAVDRLLAEHAVLPEAESDPMLRLVRRAVLIEAALGVTLTDAAISQDLLAQPEALRALLTESVGG